MRKRQCGFTLIELLIVIAIIGILATAGIPAYNSATEKAKFTEVVMATAPYKQAVDLCFQLHAPAIITGACDTPGKNGIPAEISGGSTPFVNAVQVNAHVSGAAITATAQGLSSAYTYTIIANYSLTKKIVIWTKSNDATNSSCVAASIC